MKLQKLSADADLSEASYEEADRCVYGGGVRTLVVSTATIDVGMRLQSKFGCVVEVDTDLAPDAWYLRGPINGVFSPGA